MSNALAIIVAVLAPLALPISVAVPVFAACTMAAAWRSIEQESASRSKATHAAVERSRTALGALEK